MLREFVICFFMLNVVSTAVVYHDFNECKRKYEQALGDLIVSEGYAAANAVWSLLFKSFDVNNNDVIGASEVIVKLETEKLATANDMKKLLAGAQDWIEQPRGGSKEIDLQQFVQLVSRTLGRVEEVPSASWADVASRVCSYFNSRIPDIVTSFKRLISCSNGLKEKQLELMGEPDSQQLVLATWQSVHASLVNNSNQSEASSHLCQQYQVCDVIETDLAGNETMAEFYDVVRNILFDDSTERAWSNMTSLPQLQRRMNTCLVLEHVRNLTMTSFQTNKECVSKYYDVTERILGRDSGVAPDYIFATIDGNRDGIVTSQELEAFVGRPIESRQLFRTPMSLSNVTSLLPDHVTNVGLSRLALPEQRDWNEFCLTSVRALAGSFPLAAAPTRVNVTEAVEVVWEAYRDPASKDRDAILDLLQRIRALTSTAPVMTSSGQESTTVVASDTTTPAVETTSSITFPVMSSSDSDNLVDVIRDVITELKNETNSTSSGVEGDLLTLLGDETEANNDVMKKPRLSDDELELYKVLSEYERDFSEKKKAREKSDEEELEELLEREIKKERD